MRIIRNLLISEVPWCLWYFLFYLVDWAHWPFISVQAVEVQFTEAILHRYVKSEYQKIYSDTKTNSRNCCLKCHPEGHWSEHINQLPSIISILVCLARCPSNQYLVISSYCSNGAKLAPLCARIRKSIYWKQCPAVDNQVLKFWPSAISELHFETSWTKTGFPIGTELNSRASFSSWFFYRINFY